MIVCYKFEGRNYFLVNIVIHNSRVYVIWYFIDIFENISAGIEKPYWVYGSQSKPNGNLHEFYRIFHSITRRIKFTQTYFLWREWGQWVRKGWRHKSQWSRLIECRSHLHTKSLIFMHRLHIYITRRFDHGFLLFIVIHFLTLEKSWHTVYHKNFS